MSEITNQPLYLIKFDDTEVPDETMFGAEVANKRFEQISGNWNAHLFVKVASNSRDDSCSGSNAKLASDYDALAAQRDEGLAREAELQRRLSLLEGDGSWGEMALTVKVEALQQRLAEAEKLPRAVTDVIEIARKIDKEAFAKGTQNVDVGTFRSLAYALERLASPGCADGEKAE